VMAVRHTAIYEPRTVSPTSTSPPK